MAAQPPAGKGSDGSPDHRFHPAAHLRCHRDADGADPAGGRRPTDPGRSRPTEVISRHSQVFCVPSNRIAQIGWTLVLISLILVTRALADLLSGLLNRSIFESSISSTGQRRPWPSGGRWRVPACEPAHPGERAQERSSVRMGRRGDRLQGRDNRRRNASMMRALAAGNGKASSSATSTQRTCWQARARGSPARCSHRCTTNRSRLWL